MNNPRKSTLTLSASQQTNGDQQVTPTNPFIVFPKEAIEQSIPERFEQQVAKYPDRLAVKTRTNLLTYAELNAAANRIAHAILTQPDETPKPIVLLLAKEASTLAAILGVLKSGNLYVPLDPALPPARMNFILEDTQASMIITSNRYRALAESLTQKGVSLLNIDELDFTLSPENPGLSISPDALTWILYTSGSTGQPKGVVQTHRNVLHFVMNYTNYFHICPDDRLTLLLSHSVNGGAHDIFAALLNGASLHLFDLKEEGLTSLAKWLIEEEITIYCSVPTIFRHFIDTLTGGEQFPKLRLIRLIGEPVYRRDVEMYRKHFSANCLLVNRLGSTETGSLLLYLINKENQFPGNHVPVGYPVEGNQILLLDESGKEVSDNDIGEIAVKSRYLSPGYWRRPDLTQAAFLPDPEGGNERIYLTGDLGRKLPDGRFLCMGRKDFQVKIRGYRIELAEIELTLLTLDTIKEAVVMAREDRPGDPCLVAYLVPKTFPPPTVITLRHFLTERLPDYMIPSAFVFLESLPLAPNGKVNRRALPAPAKTRPNLETSLVAPRQAVEETLGKIWAEVLGLDQVGIHDAFLDLGGDSLQAMRIISRIIQTFGVKLPVRVLLETPTVATMAKIIVQHQAQKIHSEEINGMSRKLETLLDEKT